MGRRPFRALNAVALAMCVQFGWAEEPAADSPQSNSVEIEGNVYRLVVHNNALALSRVARQSEPATPTALTFEVAPDKKIGELRLEPWLGASLCAIVELKTRKGYEYHGLTIPDPTKAHETNSPSAVFYKNKERHRILALNGTYEGDTMIAVLAIVRSTKQGMVADRGVVLFDICPNPPTEGGQSVSTIQATTQFPSWSEQKSK